MAPTIARAMELIREFEGEEEGLEIFLKDYRELESGISGLTGILFVEDRNWLRCGDIEIGGGAKLRRQ